MKHKYKLYLGRSFWNDKDLGYIYANTILGIYLKTFCKIWRLPGVYKIERLEKE